MSSSPSGSSGTGTGSRANVYAPKGQPTADFNWANLIQPLINDSASSGAGTPAALAYSQALPYTDTLGKGWANLPADATAGNYLSTALGADQTGLTYANDTLFPQAKADSGKLSMYGGWALGEGANLYGQGHKAFDAAPQILDMGLDPKNVQYNRDRGAALDAANVTNATAGIGSSPYGSSVASDALINFDSNWLDKKLKRAEDAASSYGGLLKTGGALTSEGGAMTSYGGQALTSAETLGAKGITDMTAANRAPFSDLTTGVGDVVAGETNVSNLGQAKYTLPEDTLNSLQSYMGLGQSASRLSGQLGSQGISQLGSAASGIGSALGSSTGSNLLFGSGGASNALGLGNTGLAGSLFGSGGGAGVAAADASGGLGLATELGGAATLDSTGAVVGADAGAKAAGGAETAAKAAPAIAASDRRLKTDIRKLGELDNGLPFYSFKYIWADKSRIGLMADEVEKVHPDAVVTGPLGFKLVNYAKAVK
jgi:hypothetical protein